jgi:hypothetical protein
LEEVLWNFLQTATLNKTLDELGLSYRFPAAQSFHLPLPQHVRRLAALYRSFRRIEQTETLASPRLALRALGIARP